MLANRKEGFERHTASTNPLEVIETAAGYIKDNHRFHTDTAGEQKALRELNQMKKQTFLETRRNERLKRETEIHEKQKEAFEKEQKKQENLVGTDKKNISYSRYDIITKEAKNPHDRKVQEYENQVRAYKGSLRAERLYQKSSGNGLNPITGEPLPQRFQIPPKPSFQEG
ncbi:hypothetical protein ABK040_010917 [Willaertia magna]